MYAFFSGNIYSSFHSKTDDNTNIFYILSKLKILFLATLKAVKKWNNREI